MYTEVPGGEIVVSLIVAHLIASIAAVEFRNLRLSTFALCIQSIFLSCIFAAFVYVGKNPSLYLWCISCVITKVIIIPWLLLIYIRRLPNQEEVKPIIGVRVNLAILCASLVILYRFIHTNIEFIAPTPQATVEPARSCLTIAFIIFALGVYVLVARRDAIKMVIGLCLLENGAHLSLVTLAPTLPETTIIGIATNVVVAAYLLLYLTGGIYKQLGTTDTLELSRLKG